MQPLCTPRYLCKLCTIYILYLYTVSRSLSSIVRQKVHFHSHGRSIGLESSSQSRKCRREMIKNKNVQYI